jgi:hypothetical protein
MTALRAGVTYEATSFPFSTGDASRLGWAGAQWKQNKFTPYEIDLRHLTCSTNPPSAHRRTSAGRARHGRHRPEWHAAAWSSSSPATSTPPSVAATVESLRTRGHGVTYDPPTNVTLAGFPGVHLDGETVGPKHVFVPFSPRTNKATGFPDAIELDGAGHAFRFDVLDVRDRTVVVFVGSLVMSPAEFASFLPQADRILRSIRFPKGA